jgi:predicted acyltransferase
MTLWIVGWMWSQGYPIAAALRDNGLRLIGFAVGMGLLAAAAVALVAHFSKERS